MSRTCACSLCDSLIAETSLEGFLGACLRMRGGCPKCVCVRVCVSKCCGVMYGCVGVSVSVDVGVSPECECGCGCVPGTVVCVCGTVELLYKGHSERKTPL